MYTGVDGIFYPTMHLQHTHVRQKKKRFLSIYFISAYTRTAAVSSCEDTLSGCLFYFGIHLQCTHVSCTKILNAVRVYTEIK